MDQKFSEPKTLLITPPQGQNPQAYMVEPKMVVQLAMHDLSSFKIGTSGNHLVITAPNQADILLLNFLSAAETSFPPVMQTLDGKEYSAQSLLDRTAFNESQDLTPEFNDIAPASGDTTSFEGIFEEQGLSSGHNWINSLSSQLNASEAYGQGKTVSFTFNETETQNAENFGKHSETEYDINNDSPEIRLEKMNGDILTVQTQFSPVDLGELNVDQIAHINMENNVIDELHLDLESVLAISAGDQLKISGDAGDKVFTEDFDVAGSVNGGYQSFSNHATGQEILVELGLDFDGFTV